MRELLLYIVDGFSVLHWSNILLSSCFLAWKLCHSSFKSKMSWPYTIFFRSGATCLSFFLRSPRWCYASASVVYLLCWWNHFVKMAVSGVSNSLVSIFSLQNSIRALINSFLLKSSRLFINGLLMLFKFSRYKARHAKVKDVYSPCGQKCIWYICSALLR